MTSYLNMRASNYDYDSVTVRDEVADHIFLGRFSVSLLRLGSYNKNKYQAGYRLCC